ncbi:MAG: hypothetical protein KAR25_02640 [Methanosarcinales archaeon]|nr:hypothetical protein [Methanosarcinales archaeon]
MQSKDIAILCRNIGDLLIVLWGVLLSIIAPIATKEYSMTSGGLGASS